MMVLGKAATTSGRAWVWPAAILLVLAATTAMAQSRGRVPLERDPGAASAMQISRPEQSPWLALPTADDLSACMPDGDPPPGRAIVQCRVGAKGALEHCDLTKIRDARMKAVTTCVLPSFRAKTLYMGRLVEVPMQFTEEPAK